MMGMMRRIREQVERLDRRIQINYSQRLKKEKKNYPFKLNYVDLVLYK